MTPDQIALHVLNSRLNLEIVTPCTGYDNTCSVQLVGCSTLFEDGFIR